MTPFPTLRFQTESMSTKDAYMFPVIGSGVLFSLYVLIKYISKEYVNMLLGAYFYLIGVIVTHGTLHPYLVKLLPSSLSTHTPYHIKFELPLPFLKDGGFVSSSSTTIALFYIFLIPLKRQQLTN
jgi:hypothetical protein